MGGIKGSVGETGIGVPSSLKSSTGDEGTRAGYLDWRKGGVSGARDSGAIADARTRKNILLMTQDMAIEAALKGENWIRFFLHPDSDFHRTMTGDLLSYPLRAENLPVIARTQQLSGKSATQLPSYPRALSSFHSIICHIGVGGFFRSHQNVYSHKLLLNEESGTDNRWGTVGIGLMNWELPMKEVLAKQDCLYTVIGRDSLNTTGTVVGSMVSAVHV